jgi:endonuclease YncB( thermonuclease family)
MSIRFIPVTIFLLVIGVPAMGISNYTQTNNIPSASDIINSASHIPSATDNIINSSSNLTAEKNFTTAHNTTTPRENTESIDNKTDNRTVRRNDLTADNVTTTTATSKMSTSSASSFITSDIVINEVELNPSGDDAGHQWIELFNPSGKNVSISNYKIITSFESSKIDMPANATINAGETYLVRLDTQILSHAEILTLEDSLGKITDKTPSLVDRNDDYYTWQRIPDGYNEWKFASATPGELNDPGAAKNNSTSFSMYANSTASCLGSAGCAEGVVIRIVDASTLYVRVNGVIYKVNLALIEVPTKSEQGFIKATSFTRNLCLGSNVLVDQDDKLLASNGSVIAVVYCSGTNLNSELLNNGFAIIDKNQCGTSEFASQPWAKAYGC